MDLEIDYNLKRLDQHNSFYYIFIFINKNIA